MAAILFCICAVSDGYTQSANDSEVPPNFKFDLQTAARLRPQLLAASEPASHYKIAREVLQRLVSQIRPPSKLEFTLELRVIDDGQLNAYASPDGTIYVESGLAELAGTNAGLWAAILSHEIAHVIRRDWARRYLFQKSIEGDGGLSIILDEPGLSSGSWSSSDKLSADLGQYCRRLELEADREGLMLMAQAGYHPDFVPSLHHLLHAQESSVQPRSVAAMHPCWEERDQELSRAYMAASIEFNRLWPDWNASPGGNPPVLVFTEEPVVRKSGPATWEIAIPLHCQNLAGAVEVVVERDSLGRTNRCTQLPDKTDPDEIRVLTGCTSPTTTVMLHLDNGARKSSGPPAIYVVDAWGSILAKANLRKPGR